LIDKTLSQKTTVEEIQLDSEKYGRKVQRLQKLFPRDWKIETWNYEDPEIWKWIAKKLIWSGLFIAGAALTINMFISLCKTYSAGGTQNIAAIMINKTATLPTSVVCMKVCETEFL
jgi:hypothetical protein